MDFPPILRQTFFYSLFRTVSPFFRPMSGHTKVRPSERDSDGLWALDLFCVYRFGGFGEGVGSGGLIFQFGKDALTDTLHVFELIDAFEVSMLFSVFDDGFGFSGADTGQSLQFGFVGSIDVDCGGWERGDERAQGVEDNFFSSWCFPPLWYLH